MQLIAFAGLSLVAGFGLALSGCGMESLPSSVPGAALQGVVHGGQQAVSGASISLYAAGLAGNGTGATNLRGLTL